MTNKKSELPVLTKEVDAMVQRTKELERGTLIELQKFAKLVNKPVETDKLQNHPVAKDARYLPISFMEMTLDELYFGLWTTDNYRIQQISNEIHGIIELSVFHPVAKVWLKRTGAAAIKIMTDSIPDELGKKMTKQEKNAWHLDASNKKPNALEMGGAGKLKAECIKNAALSLGKYFGRDVNREHVDTYTALIDDTAALIDSLRRKVSEALDHVQDKAEKQAIIDRIVQAENDGKADPKFYKDELDKLVTNG